MPVFFGVHYSSRISFRFFFFLKIWTRIQNVNDWQNHCQILCFSLSHSKLFLNHECFFHAYFSLLFIINILISLEFGYDFE